MSTRKLLFTAFLTTHLIACTSGSPPRGEMALTQASIRSAEAAGAVELASKPLRSAQHRVETAQRLMDGEKYEEAKHQLQLALADAELAEAMAEAKNAAIANNELQQSIELMKEEIARVQDQ